MLPSEWMPATAGATVAAGASAVTGTQAPSGTSATVGRHHLLARQQQGSKRQLDASNSGDANNYRYAKKSRDASISREASHIVTGMPSTAWTPVTARMLVKAGTPVPSNRVTSSSCYNFVRVLQNFRTGLLPLFVKISHF